MSTGLGATHPLLDGLIDVAPLFPPASLPMAAALDAYLGATAGVHAPLVGRFLCPAFRVTELIAALDGPVAPGADLLAGLVCDTGLEGLAVSVDAVSAEPRLVLAIIEYPIATGTGDIAAATRDVVDGLPDIEGYVELPRAGDWRAGLAVLADSAYGAKLRTGGTTAAAFPSDAEVAVFIDSCVRNEVPFKCTAGLHSAVRHKDSTTGFEHHGFLNLLIATSTAVQGGPIAEIKSWVSQRDATVLARRVEQMDTTDSVVARSFLVAFGSCDIEEPVADLIRLGLLDQVTST